MSTRPCVVCGTPFDVPQYPKRTCSRTCASKLSYKGRNEPTLYQVDAATRCWNWTGSLNRTGYAGSYRDTDGIHKNRHRMYFERRHGKLPAGVQLDHLCRNRRCVNPDHLEPVTPGENSRRGAAAKLTHADVDVVRQKIAAGESQSKIARLFGVCQATISHIASGRSWRDGSRTEAR